MNKTLLVLKHEVITLISRFSFWFGVLGIPLIGFLLLGGANLLNTSQGGGSSAARSPLEQVGEVFTEEEDTRPQGYVDHSGLIQAFPRFFPSDELLAYASEGEAERDMQAGKLSAYFVIAEDYRESGQVTVYSEAFNLVSTTSRSGGLEWLLAYNLLGADDDLTAAVIGPISNLEYTNVAPVGTPRRDRDDMWYFFLPYGVMMLFYVSILGSAGMLLNSVAKEKENRVMEVLLVSMRPVEMLMGKIAALGLVGLAQVAVWLVSSLALLSLGAQRFPIPPSAQLPPSLAAWGLIFFVLGYLVYASLMAGVGALVPNLREASQATTIVILPLIVPLFLISALIESPNSPVAVGLSLFPLTAPTTMMLRLAGTTVPLWQPLAAIAGLVVTAYGIIRAVAGMFRAQTLMSGQPFKIKRFFLALAGRG